jgi:hypothetical protein
MDITTAHLDNIAKKLGIPITGLDLLKSGGSLIVANEIRESTDQICKALEKINKTLNLIGHSMEEEAAKINRTIELLIN